MPYRTGDVPPRSTGVPGGSNLPNRNPRRNPHGTRAIERHDPEVARRRAEGEAQRRTTRP
jgi:hypothetical protein